MKILLPVDGSKTTRRMLSYIAAHGELLGPNHEYLAFTAVPRISARAASAVGREVCDLHYAEEAEQVLRSVRRYGAAHGWKLSTAYAAGHAPDEIAAYAQAEKPDLIVMGTHGHGALASVVMGSVASGVLARCKLPLLFIR